MRVRSLKAQGKVVLTCSRVLNHRRRLSLLLPVVQDEGEEEKEEADQVGGRMPIPTAALSPPFRYFVRLVHCGLTLLSVPGLLQGEVEKQRAERRERARNPKFNFRNYDGLRSSDDYAKVSEGCMRLRPSGRTVMLLPKRACSRFRARVRCCLWSPARIL